MKKNKIWDEIPMKMRYFLFYISGCLTALPFLLLSCDQLSKIKHDSAIEEIAEEVLEHYTGVDIDITPHSPEKKEK